MKRSKQAMAGLGAMLLISCAGVTPPRPPATSPQQSVKPSPIKPSVSPSPISSPTPLPSPSASPLEMPAAELSVTDLTPPELANQQLEAMSLSQDSPPTLYLASSRGGGSQDGIYRLQQGQKPDFMPLSEAPAGLQVWGNELYYLAEHCIKRIDLASRSTAVLAGSCGQAGYQEGPALEALLNGPVALAHDAAGRMYVADSRNFRVRKLENNQISTYAGQWIATTHPTEGLNFGCEAGVCAAGTLQDPIDRKVYFVAGEPGGEPQWPHLQVNDLNKPEGPAQLLPIVQDGERLQASFWGLGRVAVDQQGNVYVHGRIAYQDHIRRISPDGQVVTLVANSNQPGPEDQREARYPQALHTLDQLGEAEQIEHFSVSGSRLYVLSDRQLYVLDLSSGDWKVGLSQSQLDKRKWMNAPTDAAVGIRDLAADAEGNLYFLLTRATGFDQALKKIVRVRRPH